MWLAGRLGILVCFGIVPLFRIHHRIQTQPMNDAFDKCFSAFYESRKYPVGSDGWTTNVAIATYWQSNAHQFFVKIYGTNESH